MTKEDIKETLKGALNSASDGQFEVADSEDYESEVGKKASGLKKNMEEMSKVSSNLLFSFQDIEGEPLEPRETDGTLTIQIVDIESIALGGTPDTQIRSADLDIYSLQRNIEQVGLVNPIHVVPFGKPTGEDELGNPTYSRYILLDGRRRYEACRNLGAKKIPALVNTTINKHLIDVFQGIVQTSKDYTFSELVAYAVRMHDEQINLTPEVIENFFGMRTGNFLKAQYIDQMKVDYPDIYNQVEKGKMNIEQGFKKLEKEIEKAEKALEEGPEDEEEEDASDDITELQVETHTQQYGDRHILDPHVRRAVENRDGGECQCCGYGHGESDFVGVFNVHHIGAVMYGGSDSKDNLILVCQNCHTLIHDYERGKFNPEQETFDKYIHVKKAVVLGNILRRLRKSAIKEIKTKHPNTFKKLDANKISLAKAIAETGVKLNPEGMFETSNYEEFLKSTKNLEFGGEVEGALGALDPEGKTEPDIEDTEETNDTQQESVERYEEPTEKVDTEVDEEPELVQEDESEEFEADDDIDEPAAEDFFVTETDEPAADDIFETNAEDTIDDAEDIFETESNEEDVDPILADMENYLDSQDLD